MSFTFFKLLILRDILDSLVTEKERSVVTLSRKTVEKSRSNDTGDHERGQDDRFDFELDGEVGSEEDDQDLQESEGWRGGKKRRERELELDLDARKSFKLTDIEEDGLPGVEADSVDDQGAEL